MASLRLSAPCPGTRCKSFVGGRSLGYVATGHRPRTSVQTTALTAPGKDVTSEVIQRAFTLALTTRLKQWGGIKVDVRSTAWGLLEGKFGGMTVMGDRWRTPLELTAEALTVDIGEMLLDTNKLVWQQTVALKNVPQGSVSFTLSSQDLANFMVHPIMALAAARAVQGKAFVFDRDSAAVRVDPATGRGVITYTGVWAGDGQRYAVTMCTPPPAAARPAAAPAAAARAPGQVPAADNSVMALTVAAVRLRPGAQRSGTGSFASLASGDDILGGPEAALPLPGGLVGAAGSAASVDGDDGDAGAAVVGEGLRRFFSSLMLNLQGIELRLPALTVQLPPPGSGAAAAAARVPPSGAAVAAASPLPVGTPALLTITMRVAIVQLPPLDMKF
ncbi:hypothetical protein CHLRE_02g143635v5 [Chlamydomonas reinhardtii]|uniref:Uncharacterized protein n=1 Tax=Chlamydomonas reinhardtii TaxID=3055 RepID=A0A2K3E3Y2_CHLRE|nr:uncharacterized protein CHLRE_02g143635v5 [Chlamydomonas reinhardtii]PNW87504.1 hypothetical protein CHLRE_02g143635v5 [Chlamydomonas reinhardtii]